MAADGGCERNVVHRMKDPAVNVIKPAEKCSVY